MPTPIIKKNVVRFETAELEDFVAPPKKVVHSSNVVQENEDNAESVAKTSRSIISSSAVHLQSQSIEICLQEFSPLPELQDEFNEPIQKDPLHLMKEGEEQEEFNTLELEQLKRQLEQEWQKKLDEEVERAKESAFEEGYNRAKDQFEQKVENSKKEFEKGLDRIKESWENYLKRSEAILMQIALEITQFIIDIPLPKQYSDITESVLNDALDQLSRETPLALSLNPLDLLRLQESGMMDVLKEKFPALRWDPQPTLKEGNWIIQTPQQAIRRISDELLHHLKGQFGLVESSQTGVEVNSTLPGYELEYIPPVTNVAVSTTPVPLSEQSAISTRPAPTTPALTVEHDKISNVVFSPATLTATSSSLVTPDLSDLPDSTS